MLFAWINFIGQRQSCRQQQYNKEDIIIRRGFPLIILGAEDQISEITILKIVLHFPVARCLNHSRKEIYASDLLSRGDNSVLFIPPQSTPKLIPCSNDANYI